MEIFDYERAPTTQEPNHPNMIDGNFYTPQIITQIGEIHQQIPRLPQSQPSREDWTAQWKIHYPKIKRLYIDQDYSLVDVMRVMAREHNFRPTRAMYNVKFRQWGLNNKILRNLPYEVILQQAFKRFSQGKSTAVSFKQRSITQRELVTYLRRKGITQKDLVDIVRASPTSIYPIRCFTPDPGSSHLDVPELFKVPETLFTRTRAYFDSICDTKRSHLRIERGGCVDLPSSETFYFYEDKMIQVIINEVDRVSKLGLQKKIAVAGWHLRKCLAENHPLILPAFLKNLQWCYYLGRKDLALQFTYQFSKEACGTLSHVHPLVTISNLLHPSEGLTPEVRLLQWTCMLEMLEMHLGPSSPIKFGVKHMYIRHLELSYKYSEAFAMAKKLHADCSEQRGMPSGFLLSSELLVMEQLQQHRRFDEIRDWAASILYRWLQRQVNDLVAVVALRARADAVAMLNDLDRALEDCWSAYSILPSNEAASDDTKIDVLYQIIDLERLRGTEGPVGLVEQLERKVFERESAALAAAPRGIIAREGDLLITGPV